MAGRIADAFKKTQYKEQAQKVADEKHKEEQNKIKEHNSRLEKNNQNNRRGEYPTNNKSQNPLGVATAPYNFVPLAGKAVSYP